MKQKTSIQIMIDKINSEVSDGNIAITREWEAHFKDLHRKEIEEAHGNKYKFHHDGHSEWITGKKYYNETFEQ